MHLEGWISVASVAIALVAAGVAGWQAKAARRGAVAAEGQVEIMRRQHDADQAERDERDAGRRRREKKQASLITIEVDYSDYINLYDHEYALARVIITNQGDQPVLRLRIKSIGDTGMVRFGELGYGDGEPCYSIPEVLLPHASHYVPFEHLDAGGQPINPNNNIFAATSPIKKWVEVGDVTITFTDLSGIRWERTGSKKPVRVVG